MRFALDDQIAAQPDAVADVLTRDVPLLDVDRPIVFTGIGTSLHAAHVAAKWTWLVTEGRSRATAVDAHDLALSFPLTSDDQVVVISHRGHKTYPRAALEKARAAAASTVAVVGAGAPRQDADVVVRTCPNETAGTFTVSYLCALALLGRMVAVLKSVHGSRFGESLRMVPGALNRTLDEPAPRAVAERCAEEEPLLVVGFGLDAVTADEAALKLKEGARLWAEAMSTEFALHGTPAAFRAGMNAVSITPGVDDGGRTATLRTALGQLGATVWTCGDAGEDLGFAGTDPWLRPFTSIVPFQRLTAELARIRGTDPDTLHGDLEPWRSVMTGLTL